MRYRSVPVTFPGARGHQLRGRLEMPVGEVDACAVFAHCFTCSKDGFAAKRISETLAAHGIAVLRFDFTGLGQSEGDFADSTFSGDVADLVAAANWLRDNHGPPALMVGHSLGGAATLAAAHEVPDCAAVATLGAPFDPVHVTRLFADHEESLATSGEARVDIGGRPFTVRQSLVDDLRQQDPTRVATLRKPLLVMHAPHDTVVGVDNARQLFEAARHPKSFVSLDTADHLLSDRADAIYVADMLVAWASRYLDAAHPHDPRHLDTPDEGVHVAPSGEGRFDHDITMRQHVIRADEPPSVGGLDTGPAPYELVLAGLGACTAMTVRMYADRKEWPLEAAEVVLTHRKEGALDHIHHTITLRGPLDADQRTRLIEIANRCPVHRSLHSPTEITTVEG